MKTLTLEPNFSDADAFYAALADLHRDRSREDSEQINARLILLLANQVGDQHILEQALAIAGQIRTDTARPGQSDNTCRSEPPHDN